MTQEELQQFYNSVYWFAGNYTNFKSYNAMTAEKQAKYREKLTLMVCFEYSPRKTLDISKDEVREMVAEAMEYWRLNNSDL